MRCTENAKATHSWKYVCNTPVRIPASHAVSRTFPLCRFPLFPPQSTLFAPYWIDRGRGEVLSSFEFSVKVFPLYIYKPCHPFPFPAEGAILTKFYTWWMCMQLLYRIGILSRKELRKQSSTIISPFSPGIANTASGSWVFWFESPKPFL